MKQRILLLVALSAALGSCSVYKNGQTPDDVYYSPNREITGYVSTDEDTRANEGTSPDDRYLRMKSLNRNRWSQFDDDFAYWNNPMWNNQMFFNGFRNLNFSPFFNPWMGPGWNMGIGFNNGWGGWGNNFGMGGWGGFGNIWNPFFPGFYGTPIVMVNPKPINTRQYTPRGTNLNSYSNRGPVFTTDPKTGNRVYNVSGNSSPSFRTYRSSGGNYYVPSSGGSIRNSSGSPSRSFDGGSSPSFRSGGGSGGSSGGSRSSGGSNSGGSAPVRSFPRGGGQ